jgi:YHS domain-containing protein
VSVKSKHIAIAAIVLTGLFSGVSAQQDSAKALVSKNTSAPTVKDSSSKKSEKKHRTTQASDTIKPAPKKTLAPQTTCPVMGNAIDKSQYVDYKGKRIYVCCGGCIDAVKKDPETYIKKLEAMGQGVENIKSK